ncbi:MAG TPA: nucleotidyltransferase family protein [Acidobacteriaceae bacterium]|jgi:molybdenum cofactor cytidylyltransferase|nr:nucleotidyltransferase family protein [Acidobacteriaceae bacterium]
MPETRCAAVILAAGASTRLGQAKQLIHASGESLLRRTAHLALEAGCAPVVVVLGFEAERMATELTGLGVEAVVNPEWREGMGASLRCGVEAASRSERTRAKPDNFLLLVCDQPRLTTEHLRELLARHATGQMAITASQYAGRAGVPAVLAAALVPELLACAGDQGARDVIRRDAARVQAVAWPEGAVDVDRPEDLQALSGS